MPIDGGGGRDWYRDTLWVDWHGEGHGYAYRWTSANTTSTAGYTTANWVNTTGTFDTDYSTLTWRGQTLYANEINVAPYNAANWVDVQRSEANSEARAEQRRLDTEARAAARTLAISRAGELLLMLLDESQREAYRQGHEFVIIGSHGTVYRIRFGTSGNVDWLKADGTVGGRLCAHPSMNESWLPTEDVMLAQVLALKTDEREFCRIANVHHGARPPIMALVAA